MRQTTTTRIQFLTTALLLLIGLSALTGCGGRQDQEAEPPAQEEVSAPEEETSEEASDVPTPLPEDPEALVSEPATPRPTNDFSDLTAFPVRVQVERINIDAEVQVVGITEEGYIELPQRVAGFWVDSRPLAENGNTVIVGHNKTTPVEVFRHLPDIEEGDEIILTDQDGQEYLYVVIATDIIPVDGVPESEPDRTMDYLAPTTSGRLTLLTCHPAPNQCPDRFVAVALPQQ